MVRRGSTVLCNRQKATCNVLPRLLVLCLSMVLFCFFLFSAIFIPDPKDGSLYAFGSAHDGLKVLAFLVIVFTVAE